MMITSWLLGSCADIFLRDGTALTFEGLDLHGFGFQGWEMQLSVLVFGIEGMSYG